MYKQQNFTLDELEDHFLSIKTLVISHKTNSDVIINMEQAEDGKEEQKQEENKNEDDLFLSDLPWLNPVVTHCTACITLNILFPSSISES